VNEQSHPHVKEQSLAGARRRGRSRGVCRAELGGAHLQLGMGTARWPARSERRACRSLLCSVTVRTHGQAQEAQARGGKAAAQAGQEVPEAECAAACAGPAPPGRARPAAEARRWGAELAAGPAGEAGAERPDDTPLAAGTSINTLTEDDYFVRARAARPRLPSRGARATGSLRPDARVRRRPKTPSSRPGCASRAAASSTSSRRATRARCLASLWRPGTRARCPRASMWAWLGAP